MKSQAPLKFQRYIAVGQKEKYELRSFVVHVGGDTLQSGHYKCVAFRSDIAGVEADWYVYNEAESDRDISRMVCCDNSFGGKGELDEDGNEKPCGDVTMLFYERMQSGSSSEVC